MDFVSADRHSAPRASSKRNLQESRHELRLRYRHLCSANAARRRGGNAFTRYGHGGAWGTQTRIDPVKGVTYVLMVQRSKFPNSDASDFRHEFQKLAAAALVNDTGKPQVVSASFTSSTSVRAVA